MSNSLFLFLFLLLQGSSKFRVQMKAVASWKWYVQNLSLHVYVFADKIYVSGSLCFPKLIGAPNETLRRNICSEGLNHLTISDSTLGCLQNSHLQPPQKIQHRPQKRHVLKPKTTGNETETDWFSLTFLFIYLLLYSFRSFRLFRSFRFVVSGFSKCPQKHLQPLTNDRGVYLQQAIND